MCYFMSLRESQAELESEFGVEMEGGDEYEPSELVNAFAFGKCPVITSEQPNVIQMYHWGFLPARANDPQSFLKQYSTQVARIENVSTSQIWKPAINQRCLVIADAFYEWKHLDEKGKNKEKYIIKAMKQNIFCFAGLYNKYTHPITGEMIETFTVITTEANELMADIQKKKRMPVLLHKKDENEYLACIKPIEDYAYPKYEPELSAELYLH